MNPEMCESFEQNNNISQNVPGPPPSMTNNIVNTLKAL